MAAIIDIHTGAHLDDLGEFPVSVQRPQRAQLRVVHGGRSDVALQRRRVFLVRRLLAILALAALALVAVRGASMIVQAFTVSTSAEAVSIDASLPYVVQPGDTLWAVAEGVAPTSDPREVVDQIVQLNSGDGTVMSAESALQVGQRLVLPRGLG